LASRLWAVSPAPGDAVEYPGWTPLAWSIPDASPHMDAGYPVHVWGCRCHPVTVTYSNVDN